MLEQKIYQEIYGKERILFTYRTDEVTGDRDVVFRGRKSFYSVTYAQIAEALDKVNVLEEFMRQMSIAARQRGCCLTSS